MLTHMEQGTPGGPDRGRAGFTFVELAVALMLLGTVLLGLGSGTARLARQAADAEVRTLGALSADERVASFLADPRYGGLDTLYAEDSTAVGSLGLWRRTTVQRVTELGGDVEYKRIEVVVSGAVLGAPVRRTAEVGAP